jgi:hypothetical protein
MTRSHKFNDRDHSGLADGTASEEQHLPRFFAKSGHADADPNKTKKNGGGKGNWGHPGDEVDDLPYNLNNARRRSNSSTHTGLKDFTTKFETIEPEPVFEEELHGAASGDADKESTTSNSAASVEEEDAHKKM